MRGSVLLVLCVLALFGGQASAATIFHSSLSGLNENPPNASPGTGTGVFTLDNSMSTLTVSLNFSGLVATDTAAHIHCCAGPGVNASVVLNFTGVGFPTGVTSGSFSHTFTLATDLSAVTPATFLANLFAGMTYANIHSTVFPGGEIRDQLIQVSQDAPEPAAGALLGLGLCTLAGARRLRRR